MANKYVIHGATYNGDGTTSTAATGSTVTITIASPGVVTWTGHTFAANDAVYFTTTGALPTGLAINTKYYVRNPATNTFEVSLTSGGASINTSGTQSGVHTGASAGAWNDLVKCLSGTNNNGSVVAGDNVYIKCPTGTTTIDLAAGLTLTSSGTRTSPITFFFDDGTVWSGNNGTIKIRGNTAGTYNFIFSSYAHIYTKNQNLEIWSMYTSSSTILFCTFGATHITGVSFRHNTTGSGRSSQYSLPSSASAKFSNCNFDVKHAFTGYNYFTNASYGRTDFINCTFDMTGAPDTGGPLFLGGLYGYMYNFVGGRVIGSTINQTFMQQNTGGQSVLSVKLDGFDPGLMILNLSAYLVHNAWGNVMTFSNIPGTKFGSSYITNVGEVHWRDGQNYPTLNSILPDTSSTYWSYKVYPRFAAVGSPIDFPLKQKLYTSTAATKTLTVELLINNTYTNPKRNEYWFEVSYIKDSDGLPTWETTYEVPPVGGSTNLASSTAGWSTTTYGALSYTKYKMSLTTANAIKQNTMIMVKVFSTRTPTLTTDFFFVDPEVTIS